MEKKNTTTDILTVREARARLVVVRPIIEKIMRCVRDAQVLHAAALNVVAESEKHEKVRALEALQAAFHEHVAELNAHGAVLKDAERGLIDFYGWIDDDVVHLCYLYGEDTIGYWHGIKDGFAGRRPIDDRTA